MNIIFSIEFKHDFLKDPLDICLIFFVGGVANNLTPIFS